MHDNHEMSRFEREENGALVFARYQRSNDQLVIRHVEAAPILRGTGAADRLMREIVDQARSDKVKIVPLCGYAAGWLRRHAHEMIAAD